jgi:hypothetical protein
MYLTYACSRSGSGRIRHNQRSADPKDREADDRYGGNGYSFRTISSTRRVGVPNITPGVESTHPISGHTAD